MITESLDTKGLTPRPGSFETETEGHFETARSSHALSLKTNGEERQKKANGLVKRWNLGCSPCDENFANHSSAICYLFCCEPGSDLGEGKVGTCPVVSTNRGPPQS